MKKGGNTFFQDWGEVWHFDQDKFWHFFRSSISSPFFSVFNIHNPFFKKKSTPTFKKKIYPPPFLGQYVYNPPMTSNFIIFCHVCQYEKSWTTNVLLKNICLDINKYIFGNRGPCKILICKKRCFGTFPYHHFFHFHKNGQTDFLQSATQNSDME